MCMTNDGRVHELKEHQILSKKYVTQYLGTADKDNMTTDRRRDARDVAT